MKLPQKHSGIFRNNFADCLDEQGILIPGYVINDSQTIQVRLKIYVKDLKNSTKNKVKKY